MRISALGCCLIDYLYADYDYRSKEFQNLLSTQTGDGGLIKGGLVFAEDLEEFAGKPFTELLDTLVGKTFPTTNLGGPAIISLIHASQILHKKPVSCRFFGIVGNDKESELIRDHIGKTDVEATFIELDDHPTPTTYVLGDRRAQGGKGERSFVNVIGAAGELHEKDIPEELFDTDLFILGGTALVPALHEELDLLLARAKEAGAMTIVGTIFDFKNEKKNPSGRWPYGEKDAYALTDLLVCDAQEAIRMSGTADIESSARWFMQVGVPAFIITHGAKDIIAWSSAESLFGATDLKSYPVCKHVDEMLHEDPTLLMDTTGCGDNFLGGVIISITLQRLASPGGILNLEDAVVWGGSSGGLALLFHGGMFHETDTGQKEQLLLPIVDAYKKQLGVSITH